MDRKANESRLQGQFRGTGLYWPLLLALVGGGSDHRRHHPELLGGQAEVPRLDREHGSGHGAAKHNELGAAYLE